MNVGKLSIAVGATVLISLTGIAQLGKKEGQNESRFFCIATGAETLGYYQQLFPLLSEAKVSFVRIFPEWAHIQPEQSRWDFSLADSIVKSAKANNLQLLGIFLYLAPWASAKPPSTRAFPIKDIRYWRDYVREVVNRYKDEVKYWEVYNEFGSFSENGTPKDYAELVRNAYEVAKEVDPTCKVGINWNEFDLSSLQQVIEQGASGHFDFVCVHPYAMLARVMKGREEAFVGMAKQFRRMLKLTKQKENIPLWVSEIGYQAVEEQIESEIKQAEALVKAYVLCASQGIEKVFWFEGRGPNYGSEGSFGIIRQDWSKRPSFYALQTIAQLLGHQPQYLGWLQISPNSRGFVFKGQKRTVLVNWAISAGDKVKLPLGVQAFDVTGKPIEPEKSRELVVPTQPIFLTNLPQSWVTRAISNGKRLFGWLKDYSNAKEVSWRIGKDGKDAMNGLYLTNWQGSEGIVGPFEDGSYGRRTDKNKKAFYLEFDVDDSFIGVGDNEVEITVIARLLNFEQPEGTGLNLIYESTRGYRHIDDWWTIPKEPGWHQHTFRIKDANFANCWGWNFCISVVASPGDVIVKEAIVRKPSKEANTVVLPATVTPKRVPQGSAFKVRFNWKAESPLQDAYKIFVHFLDDKDRIVMQGDHEPPLMQTNLPLWKGKISYEMKFIVPKELADGSYRIVVGLYNKEGRLKLKVGKGVTEEAGFRYHVGTLIVDSKAPAVPPDTQGRRTLDLTGYELVFNEDFEGPLDVSPWGPGTRWIAHTPWSGDFGDAAFADPTPNFPFTVKDGILRIEARKDEEFAKTDPWKRPWRSGLLCSNDPKGDGFSLQYGYFEMRAKLPSGVGVWPAFWLVSSYDRTNPNAGKDGSVEIDVFEYYGFPNAYSSVVHVWEPKPHRAVGTLITTRENEVSEDFHNYGCMVTPEWIVMYFDGVEVWRVKTPAEHNKPLMILLNLALGGGWPIDKLQSPIYMYVDWVRAYAKRK